MGPRSQDDDRYFNPVPCIYGYVSIQHRNIRGSVVVQLEGERCRILKSHEPPTKLSILEMKGERCERVWPFSSNVTHANIPPALFLSITTIQQYNISLHKVCAQVLLALGRLCTVRV